MNTREANPSDIPHIQSIAWTTWTVSYADMISAAQIQYMLDRMYGTQALEDQFGAKGHRFLLVEKDGMPVGFAGFEHDHRGTQRTRLHKLYVLPHMQGAGVGKRLLNAVIIEATTAGDTAIELNVNKYNRAKEFYIRHGFHVERDEVLDIGQGFVMDDHVMWKPLGRDPLLGAR